MAKIEVQKWKKTIHEIGLSAEHESIIWDFYVSKAIAKTCAQSRTAANYGLTKLPWNEMLDKAGIIKSNVKILCANTITKTLKEYDLTITVDGKKEGIPQPIDIDTPRIVCLTPYTISDEDAPTAKVGEAESVLTHIRNAFAHGGTYFFDNGNMLLEDKDRGVITARIIIKVETLLDWIGLIDKAHKYYTITSMVKEVA